MRHKDSPTSVSITSFRLSWRDFPLVILFNIIASTSVLQLLLLMTNFYAAIGKLIVMNILHHPLSPQRPRAVSGQHSTLTIDRSEPDRALQRIRGRQRAPYRKVALTLTPCVYIY
jgi:hypothetical protein